MKLIIKNFGPICQLEFDLNKKMHIIYGENNIGKSYAISLIYILLKSILNLKIPNTLINIPTSESIQENEKHIISLVRKVYLELFKELFDNEILLTINDKAKKGKLRDYNFDQIINQVIKNYLSGMFIDSFQQAIKNSFSNLHDIPNRYVTEDCSISINLKDFMINIKLTSDKEFYIENISIKKEVEVKTIKINQEYVIKKNKITFYITEDEVDMEKFVQQFISYTIDSISASFYEIHNKIDDIYFFPASRSGLYQAMSIFSSVFARLSQLRHLVNSPIDIPALSEPVSDYFLKLSTMKANKSKDIFSKIANDIEKNILNGEIIFNSDSKKIEYLEKDTQLKLDLSETSSMISEIAPIVAYLKYVLNDKNVNKLSENGLHSKQDIITYKLIFIEEPEAHLHPKIQIEMMTFFIELINNNAKMIMTTHSDFMHHKLTNLILSKKVSPNDVSSYHMVLTEKGSLDKEDMKATSEGIDDYNFTDFSEQLYEERMNLSDLDS